MRLANENIKQLCDMLEDSINYFDRSETDARDFANEIRTLLNKFK